MAFNHYISQPKSMLETFLIKNLDKSPEKLKSLEYNQVPYYEYLVLKYYGFVLKGNNYRLVFWLRDGWLNNTPKEPNDEFKEILRNR